MSRRLTLNDVNKELSNKGITLLSKEYINNYQKLDLKCSSGHVYKSNLKSIKIGSGCPFCYDTDARRAAKSQPYKLQEAKNIAKSNGGKCLSDTYINNKSNLKFKCGSGHVWETSFKNIKSKKSWCPECSNHTITDTKFKNKIKQAEVIARKHGGMLLEYSDKLSKKFLWKCKIGHEWKATFANVIRNNSWCPYCKSFFSENICREYLEYLFDYKFIRIRPRWLLGPKNKPLELDGYCSELNLAFEHNGLQHYEEVNHFGNLKYIKKHDEIKYDLCKKQGINIIVIPALFYITQIENLHKTIEKQLNKYKISYSKSKLCKVTDVIDIKSVKNIEYKNKLESFYEIARSKNGKCLSEIYSGYNCRLKFKCEQGHIWDTTAFSIKKGSWCPKCAAKSSININNIRDLAIKNGGEILSKEYINNHTKMTWRCINKHVWKASYNSVQSGTWCPICSIDIRSNKRRIGIEEYVLAAKNKGGICLSTSIDNCYQKLEFECSKGHKWFSRADQIKNTSKWCPKCANINKRKQ